MSEVNLTPFLVHPVLAVLGITRALDPGFPSFIAGDRLR